MSLQYDEKGKYFTEVVATDAVPVIIQLVQTRVEGRMHVRSGGRIKDELNKPEQFLAVTDAIVFGPENQFLYEVEFLAVNRSHIVWIIPEEEIVSDREQEGGES
ncbi:MAG: hypothetical protein L0Z70_06005 [Chloroflexi bacterium]|nr:hypothetical protein [Chloroflexota bacterium]